MSDQPTTGARLTAMSHMVLGMLGLTLLLGVASRTTDARWLDPVRAIVGVGDRSLVGDPKPLGLAPLTQGSRVLAADGSVIATLYEDNRTTVPLSQIAPVMQRAQLAIEDSRFYEHGAIDVRGLARAVAGNLTSGSMQQGASTITQQLVKLRLVDEAAATGDRRGLRAATEKSVSRKLVELRYALALETALGKDRILEGYLNAAFYGDGAYGVEAAAFHYFGVHAKDLSLSQAATLAGLVQTPGATDPVRHPAAAQARRNVVLDRMHELGWVTAAEHRVATSRPLAADLHVQPPRRSCATAAEPYFCDFVVSWLLDRPELGPDVPTRRAALLRGGLTIHTTLDPRVQRIVDEAILRVAPARNALGVGAAAYVTRPGSGDVVAMGQNTTYGITRAPGVTAVNWAVDKEHGGSLGFQIGSTAKAFTLVTAAEKGYPYDWKVDALAAGPRATATFLPSLLPQPCGLDVPWRVHNNDWWPGGSISVERATALSTNTAFVELARQVGVCEVRDTERRFGLHAGDGSPVSDRPADIILGAVPASPQTLANAYATFGTRGFRCDSRPVTRIDGLGPQPVEIATSCTSATSLAAVGQVNRYLAFNMTDGSGRRAQLTDRPSAGKTGTANGNAQSWFVGYTRELATAVWVGNPEQANRPMFHVSMAGRSCSAMTGACFAAPIWHDIMDGALAGMPASPLP